MVKQLAGGRRLAARAQPAHLAQALETLEGHFACSADMAELSSILEYYLSSWRLPNVAMSALNRSGRDFSFDIAEYRDEIIERNHLDMQLVTQVRREPRLPVQATRSNGLHPVTVLITENGNAMRSEGTAKPLPTALFRQTFG